MAFELSTEGRLLLDLRPTAALVAYAQLLAVTSGEVEQLVERELCDNPALERAEPAPAPRLPGWVAEPAPREPADEPGVLARLAREARASLPREDHAALDYLLGSIDDRGFLTADPEVVARAVGAPPQRVHAVRALLRELGPLGFASRDVRECLDAQLDHVDADPQLVALARRLLASSLGDLAAGRYGVLARRLDVDRARVVAARDLIRARLRPFPVFDHPLRRGDHLPAAPDIVIELHPDDPCELRIQLTEERRFALRVSPLYDGLRHSASPLAREERLRVAEQAASARSFVRRLHERWATIRRVVEYAASYQRAYVLRGPAALRPLTRADVAAELGVHESTVSRAVAGRSVLLPCGRLVELRDFFCASLSTREALRELVARETRPLSDDELAVALNARGHRVARRTVAKYRGLLDIPPSTRR
ncbi:MAG: polymerase sigma-54 factor [Solirubrobacteraceae bacterium]|jgi:RNA polymerase sigma-54 factor|nr:polymerase sigma-54 factor [Solirubrobacteraceae bacterium]